jgi:hypothetical protein
LYLPDGTLQWDGKLELNPSWPGGSFRDGFPEIFVPGPIWSGERPDWMGKDWGAGLQFEWQPKIDLDVWVEPYLPEGTSDPSNREFELQRTVKLRYPGSTPEDEREALIEAAIAEYGPEVEVTFEGEGRSISIQTTQRGASTLPGLPTPPTPPIPPKVDPEDEI